MKARLPVLFMNAYKFGILELCPRNELRITTANRRNVLFVKSLQNSADLRPLTTRRSTSSLQALPPISNPVPSTRNPPRAQFDFSAGEIEAAIKSFPIGFSAGPSGLRPCHLTEMARGKGRSHLLEALASFCSTLANNSLSRECMKRCLLPSSSLL